MIAACLALMLMNVGPAEASRDVEVDRVLAHLTGIVRDDEGKPIAGVTLWWRDQYGAIPPEPDVEKGWSFRRSNTDAFGLYRMDFTTEVGKPIEGLGVSADLPGFVRAEDIFRSDKPMTRAGEAGVFDVRMTRGEVLAGVVRVPLRLGDRLVGEVPERQRFFVRVGGPGFDQGCMTRPGGGFETWVPKGRYKLELKAAPHDVEATLEDVAGGTRGLELASKNAPLAPDVLARAYDALWDDMSRNYSYFELKKIDGGALHRKYRLRAVDSGSLPALVDVLGEMLGGLNDGHVWFVEPEDAVVACR